MSSPLFPNQQSTTQLLKHTPLAHSIRPTNFDQYIGQEHIISKKSPLRHFIETDQLPSLILWGPAGCGKTTLAHIIKANSKAYFITINAVSATIKDIKQSIEEAQQQPNKKTILFIDEIHRFSKTQQDALLPVVESGLITLLGATTENPFFCIISGLLSRTQLYPLKALSTTHIETLIQQTLDQYPEQITISKETQHFLINISNGDARKCISIIEQWYQQSQTKQIVTLEECKSITQQTGSAHTKDTHYDLISAYIKSLRGSDPDAALYWLARLLDCGEPPEFIIRRMIIFASEDIGNADPHALPLTTATLTACQHIGLPEIRITLSQTTTYLALAPKSNASYTAINQATTYVKNNTNQPIPNHLKDTHYKGATTINQNATYDYPHNYPYAISKQTYWNDTETFYSPKPIGFEKTHQERIAFIKKHKNL